MTNQELEQLLQSLLPKETAQLDPPSSEDWTKLSAKFGCEFSLLFKSFIGLMSFYQFPGDIFNVSTGRTNGNDPISLVYDLEMRGQRWKKDMIPFYGIGNGDYFCLNRKECPESPVYYFYADEQSFEEDASTFEDWINSLPQFLNDN